MAGFRKGENPDPGADNDSFTRPSFPKLPLAVAGLVIGGMADIYTGGRVITMVWFISKEILGS